MGTFGLSTFCCLVVLNFVYFFRVIVEVVRFDRTAAILPPQFSGDPNNNLCLGGQSNPNFRQKHSV